MQRRKVDFPDPEGSIMHMTSPGCTVRVTPRSTSSAPKFLYTFWASTMGVISHPATG